MVLDCIYSILCNLKISFVFSIPINLRLRFLQATPVVPLKVELINPLYPFEKLFFCHCVFAVLQYLQQATLFLFV